MLMSSVVFNKLIALFSRVQAMFFIGRTISIEIEISIIKK